MARPKGSKNRRTTRLPVQRQPRQPEPPEETGGVVVLERPVEPDLTQGNQMPVTHEEAPLNRHETPIMARNKDYDYIEVAVDPELAKQGRNMKRKLLGEGWEVDQAETQELGIDDTFVMKKPKSIIEAERKANFNEWHEQTHGPIDLDGTVFEPDEDAPDDGQKRVRQTLTSSDMGKISLKPEL